MITKIFTIKWINKVLKNHDNITWQTIDNILSNNQYLDNYLPSVYNKIKGDLFEIITKYMLLQEYKICYLYQEIPNQLKQLLKLPNQDRGIDLICSNDNINFIGIQCKWRSNINQSIKKCYVTEFLHEINNSKLKYSIMITNVKKITPTFNKIQNLKWILNNTLNQKINKDTLNNILNSLSTIVKPPIKEIKNMELRNYQQEAVNALINCNEPNKKCIMACGTGKTIVMLEYINKKGLNNKKILFLFPSLHLINQIYKNFMNKFNNKNILCICSQMDKLTLTQNEANEERAEELLNNFLALDTEKKFTTDINIINERLKQNEIIVFCTYQSSELLKDQIFDIGIYDEAHKTVNNKAFGFTLINDNCNIKERLYFTATPKYFKGPEDKCISMNNVQVYGNDVYNYTFKKAIEEKYILDFKIIGYVVNKEIADIIEEKYIKKDNINVPRDVIISAIMLAEHVKKNGNCKKILTYHNTVNNALEYKKILDYIFNIYKINVSIFTMSGNTNITHREEIINEFSQADIGIICSARVLNEGIDIPCVDTVLFVETRKSTIDVTQCVGRGLRLYPGNDYCNIIIPIHYDNLLDEHNFSSIINILTAMKEIDDKIIEYFIGKKEGNKIAVKNMEYCEVIEDELQVKYNVDDAIDKMECRMMDSVSLGWDMKRLLLFEYVGTFKILPKRNCIYKNIQLFSWLQTSKKYIFSKNDYKYIKLSENIIVKTNIDKYLLYCENNKDKKSYTFEESKKMLFAYCNEYNIAPTQKTIYNNVNIGSFLGTQKKEIYDITSKKYISLSENIIIKKNLDKYLETISKKKNKEIYDFEELKNLVFEFCSINNYIPSRKTIFHDKNIGMWLYNIKHTINSNTHNTYIKLSENDIIKEHLDKYLEDKKINKNKTKKNFDTNIKYLFDYVNKFNNIPTSTTNYNNIKLGPWYNDVKRSIYSKDNKKYILLSENEIIKKNLDKYLEYKNSENKQKKIKFEDSLNNLIEYVNINNSIPKYETKYKGQDLNKFLHHIKEKIETKESNYYIQLSKNSIIKKNLDEYLERKETNKNLVRFSFNEMKEILFSYCEKENSTPSQTCIYQNKNLGRFFSMQKQNITSSEDIKYIELSKNPIIKQHLDDFLKEYRGVAAKIIDKKSFDDSIKLLFEYVSINNKVPPSREIYKNYRLGNFYHRQKNKLRNINNNKYIKLSENNIIKQDLDKYLQNTSNRTKKYNIEEKKAILLEYCNSKNKPPTARTVYKDYNIGDWYFRLKQKYYKNNTEDNTFFTEIYNNDIIKKDLKKYLSQK